MKRSKTILDNGNILVLGLFSSAIEEVYEGYYFRDEHWNGFICPYFDFNTSVKLLKDVVKNSLENGIDASWKYDKEIDEFSYQDSSNEMLDEFSSVDFKTKEGGIIHLYGFGFNWIWDLEKELPTSFNSTVKYYENEIPKGCRKERLVEHELTYTIKIKDILYLEDKNKTDCQLVGVLPKNLNDFDSQIPCYMYFYRGDYYIEHEIMNFYKSSYPYKLEFLKELLLKKETLKNEEEAIKEIDKLQNKIFNNYLLINGLIYKKVPYPCYKLFFHKSSNKCLITLTVPQKIFYRDDVIEFNFNITEYDKIQHYIKNLKKYFMWKDNFKIESDGEVIIHNEELIQNYDFDNDFIFSIDIRKYTLNSFCNIEENYVIRDLSEINKICSEFKKLTKQNPDNKYELVAKWFYGPTNDIDFCTLLTGYKNYFYLSNENFIIDKVLKNKKFNTCYNKIMKIMEIKKDTN